MIVKSSKHLLRTIVWGMSSFERVRGIIPEGWERILLVISSGIGDGVMALPLIEELRRLRPEAHIGAIVNEHTFALLKGHPALNSLYLQPTRGGGVKYLNSWWHIRRANYQVCLAAIPCTVIRYMLLPYLGGVPLRVKHAWDFTKTPERDYNFLFHRLLPVSMHHHRVNCNLDLLEAIGLCPRRTVLPKLPLTATHRTAAIQLLSRIGCKVEKPIIAFHPGCKPEHSSKRWPADRFAILGKHLIKELNVQIVIVGGPKERDMAQTIAQKIQLEVAVLAGACSVKETAAVLERCALLVCNDSGVMHMATAVGTPVLALFGPTDPRHVGPYGPGHFVIREGNDLSKINPEQVFEAAKTMLFSSGHSAG
ncbi:MAG TPA: lipopolysaccharide heptosyltransferase II [Armatimonadetes bacterium]|nr:lipopolysaccharide heptosyltransferase II [Armatimonadota bacterium]